jgi:PKD repeat protein
VNIDDAALILPTIVSMVESQVETINVLTLSVPAEYVDYVSWTPETHGAVGPETTVNFVVTFTNPGTLLETESLEIPITALGDGVVLGSTVATITMVAGVRPPVASFTVDLDVAPVSQSLGFDASDSYDPDGSIASYSWDYGDGETGEGASSVHVYEQPGEYLVILTVVDDSGATDTISLIIEAQVFSATIVDVDYPSEVEKGATFTVEVTVGYEFPILTTTSLGIFDVAKLEFAVEERVELDGAGTEVFTFELTAPDAAMTWELEANVLFLVGDTWLYDEGTSSEAFSVEVVSGAQLPWEWLLELPFEYLIIIALVLLILLILLLKRIF